MSRNTVETFGLSVYFSNLFKKLIGFILDLSKLKIFTLSSIFAMELVKNIIFGIVGLS